MLMAWATVSTAMAQESRIFIFSPDERAGLHVASHDGTAWQDMGQVCASDYGTWGVEKRMFHPSVARAKDGTWRLVFSVNDRSPLLAAAYSADLITWRPQDYPIMTTRQCMKPVVFPNPDGTFDIYYQTKGGDKRYVSASADFRHFSSDVASQIEAAAWTRDTATIGGTLREGCEFSVKALEVETIRQHFARLAEDGRRSSERMHDDGKNLPNLQPMTATLSVTNEEKAISDKLIGIFFEDISYAADGGLYAEMVQNRDFEYTPRDHNDWNATTAWHSQRPINVVAVDPLSENNPHYAVLSADTIRNEGWDGMVVKAGKRYDFSMFVHCLDKKKDFIVRLVRESGNVLAEAEAKVKTKAGGWQ